MDDVLCIMPSERRINSPRCASTCLAGLLSSSTAVDERMEPGGSTKWREFAELVLIHTRSGSSTWTLEHGGAVQLRPRMLIALAPGTRHRQHVGSEWWHAGYLMLRGPFVTDLSRALHAHGGVFALADQQGLARAELDRAVHATLSGHDTWAWECVAGLGALIARLLHHLAVDAPDAPLAIRLRRLVDHDPAAAWHVSAVAQALAMSTSALAHRCTEELGISPASWIRQRKAELARELLASGMSVKATSERLGFANPYHFSRVIRGVLGVAPSQLKGQSAASPLA